MRAFVLRTLVPALAAIAMFNSAVPAHAAGDSDAVYRLRSTVNYLVSRQVELERDIDDIDYQILRLSRVRDSRSVAGRLDELRREKDCKESRLDEVRLDVRDAERDLRAASLSFAS